MRRFAFDQSPHCTQHIRLRPVPPLIASSAPARVPLGCFRCGRTSCPLGSSPLSSLARLMVLPTGPDAPSPSCLRASPATRLSPLGPPSHRGPCRWVALLATSLLLRILCAAHPRLLGLLSLSCPFRRPPVDWWPPVDWRPPTRFSLGRSRFGLPLSGGWRLLSLPATICQRSGPPAQKVGPLLTLVLPPCLFLRQLLGLLLAQLVYRPLQSLAAFLVGVQQVSPLSRPGSFSRHPPLLFCFLRALRRFERNTHPPHLILALLSFAQELVVSLLHGSQGCLQPDNFIPLCVHLLQ